MKNNSNNTTIGICLTDTDLKQVKKFVNDICINKSALFRFLLNQSDIRLEGIANKETLIKQARENKRKKQNVIRLYLNSKTSNKLKAIKKANDTTASEVFRYLVNSYTQKSNTTCGNVLVKDSQEMTKKINVITKNNNNFLN